VLIGGFGYRLSDALQVLAGIQIKDVKVMLSYDLNTSRFSPATGTFGGFEISAMYIGTIYKRPDPDPVLFCPRF
ncbi:MAG: type IX secretion system membrane protein PorP/SprF, partial [Saprospiraceae bacterium]|nr:type IX secretion system membrane protein PorP/SprF [Saprospiraceae bacterium]